MTLIERESLNEISRATMELILFDNLDHKDPKTREFLAEEYDRCVLEAVRRGESMDDIFSEILEAQKIALSLYAEGASFALK